MAMLCPKCQGSMEAGVILDTRRPHNSFDDNAEGACWIDVRAHKDDTRADPRKPGQYEIDSYRCADCGFLELYAGGTSKE